MGHFTVHYNKEKAAALVDLDLRIRPRRLVKAVRIRTTPRQRTCLVSIASMLHLQRRQTHPTLAPVKHRQPD
ncbi:hypothetical protein K402DRAFT_394574 [Aulographum hederae CBS 113979]|uniref:Uncharacterized protein n=1 Tax=Aulographum hederae CBS 113979 TaxID=1176131 RepID=A0A6G1GXQ6_9PEZI|nr:hypothetical protein K402DRAFT_394574 [Aulographum hederae CBS 113979]